MSGISGKVELSLYDKFLASEKRVRELEALVGKNEPKCWICTGIVKRDFGGHCHACIGEGATGHKDWEFVYRTLKDCQHKLQAGGVRHSWIDPAIDIALQNAQLAVNPSVSRDTRAAS